MINEINLGVVLQYFEAGVEFGKDLYFVECAGTGKSNVFDKNLIAFVKAEEELVKKGFQLCSLDIFIEKGFQRMLEDGLIGATNVPYVEPEVRELFSGEKPIMPAKECAKYIGLIN